MWSLEREVKVDDEWHKIDDLDTTLFDIAEMFPIKYITFSCLKRAEDKPDADMEEEKPKVRNAFDAKVDLEMCLTRLTALCNYIFKTWYACFDSCRKAAFCVLKFFSFFKYTNKQENGLWSLLYKSTTCVTSVF